MTWVFSTVTRDGLLVDTFAVRELPTWEKYTAKTERHMPKQNYADVVESLNKMAKSKAEQPYVCIMADYRFYVVGFRL